MIPIEEARKSILDSALPGKTVLMPLEKSKGLVLAEDVYADRDYPPFHRACVDGYAVNHLDLINSGYTLPVQTSVYAGEENLPEKKSVSAIKVMTGAPVPKEWNVLYKVEDCRVKDDVVEFPNGEPVLNYNIDLQGIIAKKGEIIISRGSVLDLRNVGALASVGKNDVLVYDRPSVAVVSTGSELVGQNTVPGPYQIRDANYYTISYGLQSLGIFPSFYTISKDDKASLREAVQNALNYDIVLLSGGVSMGDTDYVPGILEEAGVKKVFHKVNMKPGKPLWFGRREEKSVFAFPGNPFSVAVAVKVFLEPFLLKKMGFSTTPSRFAKITQDRKIKGDRPEYFPVEIVYSDTGVEIIPRRHKGSGDLLAMTRANGIAFQAKAEVQSGESLEVISW